MEKNCIKQAPDKILEEGFSPDKLKKLALKFRDGKSLSDIERKEFESKVIFSTFDSNWRPSWPEISGLKNVKKLTHLILYQVDQKLFACCGVREHLVETMDFLTTLFIHRLAIIKDLIG